MNMKKNNTDKAFSKKLASDFSVSLDPVSYTHLRAHETREDRVWRGGR